MKPPPDSFAAAVDDFREAGRDLVHLVEKRMEPLFEWARAQPRWVLRLSIVALTVFHLVVGTAQWWME